VIPRMAPASLSRACIHDIRRANLNGSLHTLRHTYISHLVMAGVPLRTVQKLAGHSTVAVTERYSHLAPGHLLDAGRAISL
jgi:site-specific recombinase XerD